MRNVTSQQAVDTISLAFGAGEIARTVYSTTLGALGGLA